MSVLGGGLGETAILQIVGFKLTRNCDHKKWIWIHISKSSCRQRNYEPQQGACECCCIFLVVSYSVLQVSRGGEVKSLIKLFLKTQPLECHLMPFMTVIFSIFFNLQHTFQFCYLICPDYSPWAWGRYLGVAGFRVDGRNTSLSSFSTDWTEDEYWLLITIILHTWVRL